MQVWVGTSGYSYREWIGRFYPKGTQAAKMLSYYAERVNAVEVNVTFYRTPTAASMASWGKQVAGDFRFAVKAPRKITHEHRLNEVRDETASFLTTCRSLRQRLGPILFQLPPNFPQNLTLLDSFLNLIPGDLAVAMEFRHPSWYEQGTYDCLKRHGCALCIVDGDEGMSAYEATAPYGYLRLRRSGYNHEELSAWAQRIGNEDWQEVYCFFRHDEGEAPAYAETLLSLLKRH